VDNKAYNYSMCWCCWFNIQSTYNAGVNGHGFYIKANASNQFELVTDWSTHLRLGVITNGGSAANATAAKYLALTTSAITWDGNALLDAVNYTTYTVTKTGTGASGTWGISISGTAAAAPWSGITGKPTTLSGYGITDGELRHANGVPRSNLGDPTVREMAVFDAQFGNKTDRTDIANVLFETSTDGTNWTSYTVSDTDKRRFVGGDVSLSGIVIPNSTAYFRIKFRAVGYSYLNALYSYFSTNGNTTKVTIYKKHDSGSLEQHTSSTTEVSSWPGHLYLPFTTIPFNQSATLGTHYHEVYAVFQPTWNNANNINLYNMSWWGGYPAGRRNLYTTDEFGNAVFPAAVSGSTAAVGTNTTQLATTAFVNAEIANDAVTLNTTQTVSGQKTFSAASTLFTGNAAFDMRVLASTLDTAAPSIQSFNTKPLYLNPQGNAVYIGSNIALHAGNYTTYAPTLTGTNASGTWGISITGAAPWSNVSGKPTTISGYGITDTVTQAITGYTSGTNTALAATDTIIAAFGKVQGQLNAKGTGTVTSVGGTGTVSGLSLSGTVTTTGNLTLGGTLSVAASNFASQTANTVLVAPNGSAGVPTFRTLVEADIPSLAQSKITNLTTDLAAKAPLASPAFTGTPSLPTGTTGVTQTAGNSTTALATTAFVTTADNLKANLASPSFTGTPVLTTTTTVGSGGPVVGYRDVPITVQNAAYTFALADAGKGFGKDNATAYTYTIPANGTTAFPIGTAITVFNNNATSNVTIAITTDTLRLGGTTTTGSRTLAPFGVCTLLKVSSTVWIASGAGLT